jgi:molybdopterin-guanine dinucleotide biosynthesis protein A
VQYTAIVMASNGCSMAEINGVVLIGGQSRRMGQPKQTLAFGGSTLGETVVRALQPHVARVVLAGSGPVPEPLEMLLRLADPPGVAGPMAGVLTAMRWSPDSAWIVAACDMPQISAAAVRWLSEHRRPDTWAVLPRSPAGEVEALLAVYEPQARPLIEALVTEGRWGLRHLATHERVSCPMIPAELAEAWINVNTPGELESEE